MEVLIDQLGKQFDQRFVFRNINYHLGSGGHLGVRGLNGSGKSTFLSLLAHRRIPTEGRIVYQQDSKEIDMKRWVHKYLASMGPYLSLPENFTIEQVFSIYQPKLIEVKVQELLEWLELDTLLKEKYGALSSGMQQRLKIALTMYSNAELFLFDEPGNFLDDHWRQIIYKKMAFVLKNKTVIIASNDERDFALCSEFIELN